MPPDGLNIRYETDILAQEARLHEHKRAAASAFIRANGLNRTIYSGGASAKIGIITVGKSYLDVRQALDDLGIDEARADRIGLRLFKVACPWPLDLDHIRDFARGLDLIVVVEEKRSLIEVQVRENLYGTAMQPLVVGKKDERSDWLFPAKGALDPNDIAIAIGDRVLKVIGPAEDIAQRVRQLKQYQAMLNDIVDVAQRTPYFCSGCPHNSSTKVPEGSLAGGGIGCHFMALWMDRQTVGFTMMGGEGAQWVGQAPFSTRQHFFQNIGDGTYNHSGVLALRFALSAKANITYKILYNDAVAMTGGQPHEGQLTVDKIARQVRAEGVERIAVVSDEPAKYGAGYDFPLRTSFAHRDDLDRVQRELREVPGVSVLLYDQTCAAEKRRRRKRGTLPDPDKRVVINELVCEGCGDCGVQSNCVSIQPVETEFGRKRTIDQSSCNKDFSCLNGFCPSFVTVHGGKLRRTAGIAGTGDPLAGVPAPQPFPLEHGWAAIVDGIGGTGVVTIGAILGMAAHLEGKGCGMIDMAGLAQKGGAVFSHVRIARTPEEINAIRVSAGKADLILGCDLVVSGAKKVLAAVRENHTVFVANTAQIMPGDFARAADFTLPTERLVKAIRQAAGDTKAHFFDATQAATALFGNALGANMFMLGFALQHGGLPVSAEALERAIALNGEAVEMNLAALRWGRRAAHEPAFVEALIAKVQPSVRARPATSLDEIIDRRAEFLTAYQDATLARSFRGRVGAVRAAEAKAKPGSTAVTEAVARNLFKLMAVKDEYEVARLYTDGSFARQMSAQFEHFDRLEFHLAPPLLGRRDGQGRPKKSAFGPWMMPVFRLLARLKGLRGTMFDVFGYSAERTLERALLAEYQADVDLILSSLDRTRIEAAAALASVPALIRGFGHVKQATADKARAERQRLTARLTETRPVAALQAAE